MALSLAVLLGWAHSGPCRDRSALCQLWRAIILRDDNSMRKYAEALGVQGEAGACVHRARVCGHTA